MKATTRILAAVAVFLAIKVYRSVNDVIKPLPAPKLELDKYWGPGDRPAGKVSQEIVPQKVFYEQTIIDDLKKQLSVNLKLHEPLEGVGFEYGFNSKKLKEVIKYWRDDYLPRWREREAFLGQFPHYTTTIQGLKIHYLHKKLDDKAKSKKKTYPVLLLHGWPGSVREFYDFIPKLVNGEEYAFEVIAPSLPGYGWSQGASKPGMGPAEVAVIMRNLMLRLGHEKFLIQGGDWGSLIGSNIATLFPENVIGYHTNMAGVNSALANVKVAIANMFPSWFIEEKHRSFFPPFGEVFTAILEEAGYFHLQATKPDTIGAALTDNPIGLAAYILEKFSTWTNPEFKRLPDGGLEKKFTMDALLDNIMIYYLTNSITTSQRFYSEAFTWKQLGLELDRVPTTVPVAVARFKNDLMHQIDWALKDKYPNLVQSTFYFDGGHFAAFEVADLLYNDFIDFVKKIDVMKH